MKTRTRGIVAVLALALATGGVFATAPAGATNIGNEGCTPGYWKNHTSNWEEYSPTNTLDDLFEFPEELAAFRTKTLLQGLRLRGGSDLSGGAEILMRASVAAYLNAAHEGLGYPYRRFTDPFNLHEQINAALASLDRDTMINLAAELDAANNLGCPLN
jgi:hypothetical protein